MKLIEDLIIKEEDFAKKMEGEILPFLNEHSKEGYITAKDGLKLHYRFMVNPKEEAAIVISHGFCEFIPKYDELLYYFYEMGYSVFIIEHRGHGFSDRLVEGFSKVHVKHFEDYISDFNLFIEKIVIPESLTENLYLFAHSMGGGVGAMYLEKHPDVFKKAVLTSPMLQLKVNTSHKFLLALVCKISGLPIINKLYLPGHHDYNSTYKYPRCSMMSKPRYDYVFNLREEEPHYRTSGATFGWGREAFNVYKKILKNAHLVKIPVILMQASQDSLVAPEGQGKFSEAAANCKLIRFEGAKHEIFNATDDIILEYYKTVFDFYKNP
ncbi:lysophospholipase [Pseudobutyrivibrio sp. YE44]|uniref:alpha/beta fold hydrolase n=1 Tax=Pseudobutyrivibrio sp. YE44 TaxID=1520802 RepID=UPI00088FA134|nr:alpha/beta hydrolase [Pseudobutyrivibrio sp. YE44]SDB47746.1 lysophospholipase [Pseudobutyrivibrio sp. YE44]